MLGTQDLLVGLVLAAFFFGAKRLPELARPTCNTALEPEWTHCPRCGTAASAAPPTSGAV